VDITLSGPCSMAGRGVSGVGHLVSADTVLDVYDVNAFLLLVLACNSISLLNNKSGL
jgi:hypothetical protein